MRTDPGRKVKWRRLLPVFLLCGTALSSGAAPAETALARAEWIWSPGGESLCHFRRAFVLEGLPKAATLWITADNGYELQVNGSLIGSDIGAESGVWQSVERYDIAPFLREGTNVIAVRAIDLGGERGLLAAMEIEPKEGAAAALRTGSHWRVSGSTDPTGYARAEFIEGDDWKSAAVRGPNGVAPWGKVVFPGPVSPRLLGAKAQRAGFTEPGPDFRWPDAILFLRGRVPETALPGAQQAIWRIGNSKAYLEMDVIGPSVLGRAMYKWTAPPVGRRAGERVALPETELLLDAGPGLIGSPSVSYDGQTIYFSHAPAGGKFFHVWAMDASGGNLVQLTSGPFHDFDPEPLPDGRLVFSSTRLGGREEYHGNAARSLHVMAADGTGIRPITHHIVGDMEPKVTASGTIAFVRQDNFMERAKVETQVHAVRPDGSGGQVLLGANRLALDFDPAFAAEEDARWLRIFGFGSLAPLPDGRVACLSMSGLMLSGGTLRPQSGVATGLDLFDISALPDGRLLCTTAGLNALGVLDLADGSLVRLYEKPPFDVHSPVFLGARDRQPVLQDQVDPHSEPAVPTGFLLCQNIWQTRQTNAALSRIRAVRVIEGRPFSLRSAQHQYAHLGVEAVELGTVPVAADGSFFIEVPADRALALQAVDAEGRSVINEMSWIYVRPGERRACVGCHQPAEAAPPTSRGLRALRSGPVSLTGAGRPLRFRGNNGANGGMLNLQFDRFRETASIDLHGAGDGGGAGTRAELVKGLTRELRSGPSAVRASAAQRLGLLNERGAAEALSMALKDADPAVRMSAAFALARCGVWADAGAPLNAMNDPVPAVAQAAFVAFCNLTGYDESFDAFHDPQNRAAAAKAARTWWNRATPAEAAGRAERKLELAPPGSREDALNVLGRLNVAKANEVLRLFVAEGDKTDLRAMISAIRGLGAARDEAAIPLLRDVLLENVQKPAKALDGNHEFGWTQRPVHLAAAAAESLGRIGSRAAEDALMEAFNKLDDFWYYSFQTGDHDWLMGCQASLPHYRLGEAFERIGGTRAAAVLPVLIRSVPIDPDRGLLFENDAYETITGRLAAQCGATSDLLQACLSALGDPEAKANAWTSTVTASPPAVSVGIMEAASRAAQILSILVLDEAAAPSVRLAFERFRRQEPSRVRSWTCFYLARTLGKLGDAGAVDLLVDALDNDPTEASFGLADPPNVFLHYAMTPCYRAACADALGRIADPRGAPVLVRALRNFDNAMDVRQAAAQALVRLARQGIPIELGGLAKTYPETASRRLLLEAEAAAEEWNRATAAKSF